MLMICNVNDQAKDIIVVNSLTHWMLSEDKDYLEKK